MKKKNLLFASKSLALLLVSVLLFSCFGYMPVYADETDPEPCFSISATSDVSVKYIGTCIAGDINDEVDVYYADVYGEKFTLQNMNDTYNLIWRYTEEDEPTFSDDMIVQCYYDFFSKSYDEGDMSAAETYLSMQYNGNDATYYAIEEFASQGVNLPESLVEIKGYSYFGFYDADGFVKEQRLIIRWLKDPEAPFTAVSYTHLPWWRSSPAAPPTGAWIP